MRRGAGRASGGAGRAAASIVVVSWCAVEAEGAVGGGAAEAVGDGRAGEADLRGEEESVGAAVATTCGIAGPVERAGP